MLDNEASNLLTHGSDKSQKLTLFKVVNHGFLNTVINKLVTSIGTLWQ